MLLKWAQFLLIATISVSAAGTNAQPITPGETLPTYSQARVVRIHVHALSATEEVDEYGTGFLISSEGAIITAAHVITPYLTDNRYEQVAVEITRITDDGPEMLNFAGASLVQSSNEFDVAVLYATSEGINPLPFFCLRPQGRRQLQQGSPITVAANRFTDNYNGQVVEDWERVLEDTTIGATSSQRSFLRYWETSTPFWEGMSGGAVLFDNEVVGVVSASELVNGQPTGVNFIVPLERLGDLRLDTHAASCRPSDSGGVRISQSGGGSTESDQLEYEIILDEPGLLLASAFAAGRRQGTAANAGIRLTIIVDQDNCSRDYSFEGTSSSITFNASASCALVLGPGSHQMQVSRDDDGITDGQYIEVSWQIIRVLP